LTLPKGTTRNEANQKLGEIEKKVAGGIEVASKKPPRFSEVAHKWLASKEPNIRDSTYAMYEGYLRNHLKPYFGNLKITQISFSVIDEFKTQSLENGVTPVTLRKILVNLGAILSYAVKMKYIDFNPARDVEKPKGKSLSDEEGEMVILKPEEIRTLLDAAADQRDRVLFMAAVLTGARQGELLGLKWGDIDWRNSQIHIRRTYNHGHFYEPKSKTSRRKIDVAPELLSELKKWKLRCPPGKDDLVFPTGKGTPENATNMRNRQFFPALRRAGLPQIGFHTLRHTYASLLIDQGENIKYIQTQLGHSSINLTVDTYGHLLKDVNREAASRLGKVVLGGNGSNLVAKKEKGLSENR
jgi:integrase